MRSIKTQRKRKQKQQNSFYTPKLDSKSLTFMEHLRELRGRVLVIVVAIVTFACIGYAIQKTLVNLLLKPSHGQHFIYTSPIGGVGFLFSLTTDFGILIAIPIIIYELLSFINPVLKYSTRRLIIKYCVASALLATIGVVAGYVFGLPIVLSFLSGTVKSNQIQPLLTISEYLSFVSLYLFGVALIFQIPVIISFINRIKPIKPKTLLHYERHVIVIAFIIAAIMVPTINVAVLFMIAGPIIAIYNLGILMIWQTNKGRLVKAEFMEKDREAQLQRQALGSKASLLVVDDDVSQDEPAPRPQERFVRINIVEQ